MSVKHYGPYELKNVYGHIEVFRDGRFVFSADTYEEACREIDEGDSNDEK